MLVAIAGNAGAGKDALGAALCARMGSGWRICKFSEAIKAWLESRHTSAVFDTRRWEESDATSTYRTEPVPALGGASRRDALIELGMGVRREDPDFWVRYLLSSYDPAQHWVITDMRFPNEMREVRSRGGVCVYVERPGVVPVETVSERALDANRDAGLFDVYVANAGGLDDLPTHAAAIASACELRS